MKFRMVERCPLCDRDNSHHSYYGTLELREIFRKFGYDELLYVICECGLIFQWWAMTPETLAEYYKNIYRKMLGKSTANTDNGDIKRGIKRAKTIVKFLDESSSDESPNNVLDIGCAAGYLLVKLRDTYKCEVTGIEPDDNYREYSQGLGLNVLSNLESLNGNQKFDLITATHVLEHFIEPMPFLEKVRGLMSEGGKLILEVPLMSPRLSHPIVFTEETFRKMLHKAGFGIDRLIVGKHRLVMGENLVAKAYIDTEDGERGRIEDWP